jgi:hypothetical protein
MSNNVHPDKNQPMQPAKTTTPPVKAVPAQTVPAQPVKTAPVQPAKTVPVQPHGKP